MCAVYDIQAGEGLDTVKINSLQKAIDFIKETAKRFWKWLTTCLLTHLTH